MRNRGGESTASATFTKSDDGKTLTITGKGDLSKISQTTTIKSYTFNESAVGKVFTKVDDTNYSSVNANDNYNSDAFYYYKALENTTPIVNLLEKEDIIKSKSTVYSWNSEKLDSQPLYTANLNSTEEGTISHVGEKVLSTWNIPSDGTYYIYEDVNGNWTTSWDNKKYTALSKQGMIKEGYIIEKTEFTTKVDIYMSPDGNKSNITTLTAGTTYTYNPSATYYTGEASYKKYSDTESWTKEDNSGFLTKKTSEQEMTFVQMLRNNLTGVTKLLFEEETKDCGIIINKEIVQTILLPTETHNYNTPNTTLEELDLGKTTISSITTDVFEVSYAASYYNISTLTLPKTEIVDDNMTVPEGIISNFAKNINTKLTTVIIPTEYTKIGDKAFKDIVNVKNFKIPANVTEIGTSAFEGCVSITEISLNEGLVTIGKRAFVGTNLTNISFPSTLLNILAEAFSNVKTITELKFNQGLEFIGNCAFYSNSKIVNCQEVINIPSSVKYIGPGAFSRRWFKDVYFYSSTAPVCPVGKLLSNSSSYYASAFDDNIHMGNKGFKPSSSGNTDSFYSADDISTGYANRMNYINHDYYLAMLHFPVDISEENAKTYTDITRVYTTYRQTNGSFYASQPLTVGKEQATLSYNGWSNDCAAGIVNPGYEDTYLGSQYIWPSQPQWMRSFVCNSLGLEWDGVTEYRPKLNADNVDSQINLMIKDELTIKYNSTDVKITAENYTTYSDELSKIAYLGTRQFVLADGDHANNPTYTIDVEGGKWWTLCVPFNMTKAEIDDVFGKNTYVCLFSGVDRVGNAENNSITFKFQNDVYRHKTVKNSEGKYSEIFSNTSEACTDKDIVIYAHEAYMIYPTKTDKDVVFVVNDYEPVSGSPLPTIVKASDNTEYRFVGNYTTKIGNGNVSIIDLIDITIPQYCYMYAKKNGDTDYQFWFYSGNTMNWKANKCVVQTTEKGGGVKDYTTFFTNPTNSAKQTSIFGMDMEDSDITAVKNISFIAGEEKENYIYDICGRRISVPQKGMYIKNGKKYIIK